MLKYSALVSGLILIAGCATQMPAEVTSASDSMVVIKAAVPDKGVEDVIPIAESECRKYGLKARIYSTTNPNSNKYIFNCF